MGYFGRLAYSDGRWTAGRPTAVPFLLLDVHDSRLATVDYRAADATGGRFFLGWEPRFYFEDPEAAEPVDTDAAAADFAAWATAVTGAHPDAGKIAQLLASPTGTPPDADGPVEETVVALLDLVGLPSPAWPRDDDEPAG